MEFQIHNLNGIKFADLIAAAEDKEAEAENLFRIATEVPDQFRSAVEKHAEAAKAQAEHLRSLAAIVGKNS